MTITETAQIVRINRSAGIGGTDAMRIMAGDWQRLYREKLGLDQPEDLSGVFKVQLGIRSEAFHAEWFERMTGIALMEPSHTYVHREHQFMLANIDRLVPNENSFLELKHSRNGVSVWDKARFYMPQLQHYIEVLNVDYCYFSVIRGNDEPVWCKVERDDDYIEGLIKMESSFWWHVKQKVEPEITPQGEINRITKKAESIKVDGLIVSDMRSNNLWADAVERFLKNQEAAKTFEAAKEDIKSLVTDDIGEAYGHGVTAKRDKRGRILIRASKENDNDTE